MPSVTNWYVSPYFYDDDDDDGDDDDDDGDDDDGDDDDDDDPFMEEGSMRVLISNTMHLHLRFVLTLPMFFAWTRS